MADHERGDDLVKRLRDAQRNPYGTVSDPEARQSIAGEAADEIERLRSDYLEAVAEIERLRAATERAEREATQHFRQAMVNGERAQAAEAERDELRARVEGIDKILEPLTGEG